MLRRFLFLSGSSTTSKGVVDGIIQDDWETIIEICRAGMADRYYKMGDSKLVTTTDGGVFYSGTSFYMEYIGTGLDIRSDGLTDPLSTWIIKESIGSHPMSAPSGQYKERFYDNASRKKSSTWWLDDLASGGPGLPHNTYYYVTETGSISSKDGDNSAGIIFGFCI